MKRWIGGINNWNYNLTRYKLTPRNLFVFKNQEVKFRRNHNFQKPKRDQPQGILTEKHDPLNTWQETTCEVRDLITSFAAVNFADSSAAKTIASWACFLDFLSSASWISYLCLKLSTWTTYQHKNKIATKNKTSKLHVAISTRCLFTYWVD